MNCETIEKNRVKLTFEVSPERFEEGLKYSYNKNKGKLKVQGFRQGKAPRKILEMNYGKEVFFEDAIDFVLDEAYATALKESGINAVSRPEIDITDLSTETGVKFTALVYTKPEITIEGYKGVTYTKFDTTVTEEEILKEIDVERNKSARVVTVEGRETQDGDTVIIDFVGTVDDVPFPGGASKDFELTLGSKTFIDNFEDQLIGKKVGEEVEVFVNFPEEYHAEELSGKPAKFMVTINEIKVKELPELNDDFATDVSEFDTIDAYKESVKEKIQKAKEENALRNKENQIIDTIVKNNEMDIPQVMIDNHAHSMLHDFEAQLKRQNIPLDLYLQYIGQTKESMLQTYTATAEANVKGRLALEAIAKQENIEITDADFDVEYTKIAEAYKMEKEKIKEVMREEDVKALTNDLKVKKALEFVLDNAVEIVE